MDPLHEEALHHERHMRIICIGAGASGLLLAYKLQRSFQNFTLTIFDKNAGVSGTWLENRCACDVPAHNYTYSFEPKLDWTTTYAGSEEIRGYFESFATKYDLHKYIRLQHRVVGATWSEAEGEWHINVHDTLKNEVFHQKCHILINATGYLNNWAWPKAPGMDTFAGELVHSANWKEDLDLRDKDVILIGNGSSAVQILPAIQPIAKSVATFVRSPQWILPSIGTDQETFTPEQIQGLKDDPQKWLRMRKRNETVVNSLFSVFLSNSKLQAISKVDMCKYMGSQIHDEEMRAKLIPPWGVGCRRLTPGRGYLQSLVSPNVQIVYNGVKSFSVKGCIGDDGIEYVADVVICATGFNMTFAPRFPLLGAGGINLQDAWATAPASYLGLAVAEFPNLFLFLGPYSPVANGPTVAAMETQADYILALLDRFQTENIRSFAPKPAAQDDFIAHVANYMRGAVYTEPCRSGHKNHTVAGRVPTLWPGSTLHYIEALREVRADDWDIVYEGNRFSWLGNGISQTEFDPTSDLAYYIRNTDDGPWASRRKRREHFSRTGSQPARELHRIHRPEIYNV